VSPDFTLTAELSTVVPLTQQFQLAMPHADTKSNIIPPHVGHRYLGYNIGNWTWLSNTSSFVQTFNWAFGGVLEVYNIH
jgi:hypothetical protein